jgi:glucan biosynthesis protein C
MPDTVASSSSRVRNLGMGIRVPILKRYYGIDIWRAGLLSLGVFVHAAWLRGPDWMDLIPVISHHFRMEAFFMISGFLAKKSLDKSPENAWRVSRLTTLLMPLLIACIFLIPLTQRLLQTNQVIHAIGPDTASNILGDPVIHLWFLVNLAEFTIVLPIIIRCAQASPPRLLLVYERYNAYSDITKSIIIIAAMALTAILISIARGQVFGVLFSWIDLLQDNDPLWRRALYAPTILLRVSTDSPYYILFYAVGVLLASDSRFLSGMIGSTLVPLLVLFACFFIIATFYYYYGVSYVQDRVATRGDSLSRLFFCTKVFSSIATCMIIMRHAVTIKSVPQFTKYLVDSSYSVYLLHVTIMFLIIFYVSPIVHGSVILYVVVSALTLILSYAVHALIVKRFWLTRFLLNGKKS